MAPALAGRRWGDKSARAFRSAEIGKGILMTDEEFDVVAGLIGSRGPARDGAKLVLVDGKGPAEAARVIGGHLLPQNVSNTARRIRQAEDKILKAYVQRRLTKEI